MAAEYYKIHVLYSGFIVAYADDVPAFDDSRLSLIHPSVVATWWVGVVTVGL